MKKINRILAMLLCLIYMGTATNAFAAANTSDSAEKNFGDFAYETVQKDGAEYICIYGYKGDAEELVIPSEINGIPVKTVGKSYVDFFNNNEAEKTNLKSITFENGIENIGQYFSFYQLPALKEIIFPNTAKKILGNEFIDCTAIESISFPNSVKEIGIDSFLNCTSLKSITIPNGVTIGEGAFEKTAAYNDQANHRNGGIYISNYLIRVDNTYKGIFQIPEGTYGAAERAFDYSSDITGIKVPASVTVFPENPYVLIGSYGKISSDYKNLKGIYVNSKNKQYSSKHGVLYNKSKTKLLWYPAGKDNKKFKIANSVKYINDYAFYNAKVKSVTFGKKVKAIGEYAFKNCKQLRTLKLNKGLKTIGAYAFYNCKSLKVYTIPKSVKKISRQFAIGGCDPYEQPRAGTLYRYRSITIKGYKKSAAWDYYKKIKKHGSKAYKWKFTTIK